MVYAQQRLQALVPIRFSSCSFFEFFSNITTTKIKSSFTISTTQQQKQWISKMQLSDWQEINQR